MSATLAHPSSYYHAVVELTQAIPMPTRSIRVGRSMQETRA